MLDYLSTTDFNGVDMKDDGGDINVFDEDTDDIDIWIIDESDKLG